MKRDGDGGAVGADWEPLAWDSARFGFPVARLRAGSDPGALERALGDLRAAGTRLAYWTADPADQAGLAAARALGGTRVDERLVYVRDPLAGAQGPVSARSIGTPAPGGRGVPAGSHGAAPDPVPVVEAIGRGWDAALEDLAIRAGAFSRFRTDPRFPEDRFRDLYREWMRKSLSGERADAVLAVPGAAGPEGMITLAARDGIGSIGLIAVAEGCAGRGLGSALMRAAEAWFRSRGCARAEVPTQAANVPACALYERQGYRVAQRSIVYHFWL